MSRRLLVIPCCALVVMAVFLVAGRAAAAQPMVRLRGHIPGAVDRAQIIGRVAAAEKVNLALALPLRDPAGLQAFLTQLYEPASPLYGHYLTAGGVRGSLLPHAG